MLYVLNFVPMFCPNCGEPLWHGTGEQRRMQHQDFAGNASFTCKCGAKGQHAQTEHILNAADLSRGDMRIYFERGI